MIVPAPLDFDSCPATILNIADAEGAVDDDDDDDAVVELAPATLWASLFCQANVEQSKHRVFPVPVGDSRMAFDEVLIACKVFLI